MHVFFEDDGQLQGRHGPRRQRLVAAGRGRLRQAPEGQGRGGAAALRRAVAGRAARRRAEARARSSTRISCGRSRPTTSSASPISRASTSATRPLPAEAAAVALALAAAPMYFYKRGKGRYRKAPPDALKAALASVERKKREARADGGMGATSCARTGCPTRCAPKLPMLLYKPDKNALEWKALAAACDALQTNPVALLADCGAIPSSHDYHYNAFLAQAFPQGIALPRVGHAAAGAGAAAGGGPRVLDRRRDDDRDRRRVFGARAAERQLRGRHPHRRARARDSRAARRSMPSRARGCRPSTCPGARSRCCPTAAVDAFTLARRRRRRRRCRCTPRSRRTARWSATRRGVNRVPVAANLRLDAIGDAFANDLPVAVDPPWTRSCACCGSSRRRSPPRAASPTSRGSTTASTSTGTRRRSATGRVRIVPRPRGSPLDKVVSELMIFVNSTWGKLLADARVAGLYRTQANGKVKMSTRPGEHQGLGLAHYLWASSPLRRYSDLVNQRQLLAALAGDEAALRGQRRRALRRAHRFRGDVLELRRVPGPDGALLVPALAAAGAA